MKSSPKWLIMGDFPWRLASAEEFQQVSAHQKPGFPEKPGFCGAGELQPASSFCLAWANSS